MPPPVSPLRVNFDELAKWQRWLDEIGVYPGPVAFSVSAGSHPAAGSLEAAVDALKTALDTEGARLRGTVQGLRQGLGTYATSMREASNDTARANVGFSNPAATPNPNLNPNPNPNPDPNPNPNPNPNMTPPPK